MIPLVERTIYVTDKFYDVQALVQGPRVRRRLRRQDPRDHERRLDLGRRPSGIEHGALRPSAWSTSKHGWIVGPGRAHPAHAPTAARPGRRRSRTRPSRTPTARQKRALPLRARRARREHAPVRGRRPLDPRHRRPTAARPGRRARSRWSSTRPGGESARGGAIRSSTTSGSPIAQHGWIVGEFGKIMYTADGGADLERAGEDAPWRERLLRPPRPADASSACT